MLSSSAFTSSTPVMHSIQILNLSGCNRAVTDTAIDVLSKCFPNLVDLNLSYCTKFRATKSGRFLSPRGKRLNSLRRLTLTGCTQMDDDLVLAIIEGEDSFMSTQSASRAKSAQHKPKMKKSTAVPSLKSLEHLDLRECRHITSKALRILCERDVIWGGTVRTGYSLLRSIELSNCQSLDDEGLSWLISGCPNLERLVLSDLYSISDLGIKEVSSLHKLRTLHLSHCPQLTSSGLLAMVAGGSVISLLLNSIDTNNLGVTLADPLAATVNSRGELNLSSWANLQVGNSTGLCALEEIILVELRGFTDMLLDAISRVCTHIRVIELRTVLTSEHVPSSTLTTDITSSGVRSLSRGCRSLERLCITCSPQIGATATRSLKKHCKLLKSLSFAECSGITDDSIANISECHSIGEIDLSFCSQLTDRGVKLLPVWNLQSVKLCGCTQITDTAIKWLARICGADLRYLDLSHCTRITQSGLLRVLSKCPLLESLNVYGVPHIQLQALTRETRLETVVQRQEELIDQMEPSESKIMQDNWRVLQEAASCVLPIGMLRSDVQPVLLRMLLPVEKDKLTSTFVRQNHCINGVLLKPLIQLELEVVEELQGNNRPFLGLKAREAARATHTRRCFVARQIAMWFSAYSIQRLIRVYLAKQMLCRMRARKNEIMQSAIILIQTRAKGWLARRRYRVWSARVVSAVLLLQKVLKKFAKARKEARARYFWRQTLNARHFLQWKKWSHARKTMTKYCRQHLLLSRALNYRRLRLFPVVMNTWKLHWHKCCKRNKRIQLAMRFYQKKLCLQTFGGWSSYVKNEVSKRRALCKVFLCAVQIDSFNSDYQRLMTNRADNLHAKLSLIHAFRGFRETLQRIERQKTLSEEFLRKVHIPRFEMRTLMEWQKRSQEKVEYRKKCERAHQHYLKNLKKDSICRWNQYLNEKYQSRNRKIQAMKHNRSRLLRMHMNGILEWRKYMKERRQAQFQAILQWRRKELVPKLASWSIYARKRAYLRENETQIREKRMRGMMQITIMTWSEFVIQKRLESSNVLQQLNKRTLLLYGKKWVHYYREAKISAIMIQTVFRRFYARKWYLKFRDDAKRSALVIQCRYRTHLAIKKRVKLQRRRDLAWHLAEEKEQEKMIEADKESRMTEQIYWGCSLLQRVWRGYVVRKMYRALRREKQREREKLKLKGRHQDIEDGYQRKIELEKQHELEKHATIRIQSVWRRKLAWKVLNERLYERFQGKMAAKIQAMARRYLAQKQVAAMKRVYANILEERQDRARAGTVLRRLGLKTRRSQHRAVQVVARAGLAPRTFELSLSQLVREIRDDAKDAYQLLMDEVYIMRKGVFNKANRSIYRHDAKERRHVKEFPKKREVVRIVINHKNRFNQTGYVLAIDTAGRGYNNWQAIVKMDKDSAIEFIPFRTLGSSTEAPRDIMQVLGSDHHHIMDASAVIENRDNILKKAEELREEWQLFNSARTIQCAVRCWLGRKETKRRRRSIRIRQFIKQRRVLKLLQFLRLDTKTVGEELVCMRLVKREHLPNLPDEPILPLSLRRKMHITLILQAQRQDVTEFLQDRGGFKNTSLNSMQDKLKNIKLKQISAANHMLSKSSAFVKRNTVGRLSVFLSRNSSPEGSLLSNDLSNPSTEPHAPSVIMTAYYFMSFEIAKSKHGNVTGLVLLHGSWTLSKPNGFGVAYFPHIVDQHKRLQMKTYPRPIGSTTIEISEDDWFQERKDHDRMKARRWTNRMIKSFKKWVSTRKRKRLDHDEDNNKGEVEDAPSRRLSVSREMSQDSHIKLQNVDHETQSLEQERDHSSSTIHKFSEPIEVVGTIDEVKENDKVGASSEENDKVDASSEENKLEQEETNEKKQESGFDPRLSNDNGKLFQSQDEVGEINCYSSVDSNQNKNQDEQKCEKYSEKIQSEDEEDKFDHEGSIQLDTNVTQNQNGDKVDSNFQSGESHLEEENISEANGGVSHILADSKDAEERENKESSPANQSIDAGSRLDEFSNIPRVDSEATVISSNQIIPNSDDEGMYHSNLSNEITKESHSSLNTETKNTKVRNRRRSSVVVALSMMEQLRFKDMEPSGMSIPPTPAIVPLAPPTLLLTEKEQQMEEGEHAFRKALLLNPKRYEKIECNFVDGEIIPNTQVVITYGDGSRYEGPYVPEEIVEEEDFEVNGNREEEGEEEEEEEEEVQLISIPSSSANVATRRQAAIGAGLHDDLLTLDAMNNRKPSNSHPIPRTHSTFFPSGFFGNQNKAKVKPMAKHTRSKSKNNKSQKDLKKRKSVIELFMRSSAEIDIPRGRGAGGPNHWGLYITAEQEEFEGPLVDNHFEDWNLLNGLHVIRLPSGLQFEGRIFDSKPQGKGKLEIKNKFTYEGMFDEGKRHGKGRYSGNDGSWYDGDWIHDKRHGHGKLCDPQGGTYEGTFVMDCFHGTGIRVFADGRKYQGDWFNGEMHGVGTMWYTDGSR